MFDDVKQLLKEGIYTGCYPGAVLLIAHKGEILCIEAQGKRSDLPCSLPMKKDTFFDLASLTKALATTLCIMKLVDRRQLHLDLPISHILSLPRAGDKASITPRMLLSHCSGLSPWEPFYSGLIAYSPAYRKSVVRKWIIEHPLSYLPGTESLYSDLGFILLEWIIEEVSKRPMDKFFFEGCIRHISFNDEGIKAGFFGSDMAIHPDKQDFAATEICLWRRRVIQGEVHDENAHALGGFSGHAGMYGRAADVYAIVHLIRDSLLGKNDFVSPKTVEIFFTRQAIVKESTWALGWDTPSEKGSSAGSLISENSVGHLGFTGTSLWFDMDKDVVVVLLTNRVHPSRSNEKIREFRPKIHDMIFRHFLS